MQNVATAFLKRTGSVLFSWHSCFQQWIPQAGAPSGKPFCERCWTVGFRSVCSRGSQKGGRQPSEFLFSIERIKQFLFIFAVVRRRTAPRVTWSDFVVQTKSVNWNGISRWYFCSFCFWDLKCVLLWGRKNWISTEKLLCRIWAREKKFWVNFNSPRKVTLNFPQPTSLKFGRR